MGVSSPQHLLPQILPMTDWGPLEIGAVPSHLLMVR